MSFDKWFDEQELLIKVILLIIPVVGWVLEILVRLSVAMRKSTSVNLVGLVLGAIGNYVWQVVDVIYLIVKGELLLIE